MTLIGIDCEWNGAREAPLQSYGTWDEPTRPWHSLTAYISDSIKDRDVQFWRNVDSNFKMKIYVFHVIEIMRLSKS